MIGDTVVPSHVCRAKLCEGVAFCYDDALAQSGRYSGCGEGLSSMGYGRARFWRGQ